MTTTHITINDTRWKNAKLDFGTIVNQTLKYMGHKKPGAEVSILLTNDSEIQKLNSEYRGKNKPTNVLSFETGDDMMLGDIVLSYDTVERESISEHKSFKNHATHLIIHGVLHLLGYDHIDENQANEMEGLEQKILNTMKIADPYSDKHRKLPKWLRGSLLSFGLMLLGAFTSLGFAPTNFIWASIIGMIVYYIVIFPKHGFINGMKTGFWFGAGYALTMLSWMTSSFFVDATAAATFGPLLPLALMGIGIGGGIIFGLPAALTAMTRETSWRHAVFFATFSTLILWARGWILTGFPWNPFGLVLMPYAAIANSMSLIGSLGLSFLLIGLCSAIGFIIAKRIYKIPARTMDQLMVSVFAILLFACSCYGAYRLNMELPKPIANVRLVQAAIPQQFKWDPEMATDHVNKHIMLSNLPSKNHLDAIIWPESAYPFVQSKPVFLPATQTKMRDNILISGAILKSDSNYYNGLIVANTSGNIIQTYQKHHLVPFGEYNPFEIIGMGALVPMPGSFGSGNGVKTIETPTFSFAPAICYEIIFSGGVIGDIKPKMILNITNDGWFGTTSGPYQHLNLAIAHAIETGTSVTRVSYSGISAVIDPVGYLVNGERTTITDSVISNDVSNNIPLQQMGVLDVYVPGPMYAPYLWVGPHKMMILILLLVLITTKIRFNRK